jgi:hypothetical protein
MVLSTDIETASDRRLRSREERRRADEKLEEASGSLT